MFVKEFIKANQGRKTPFSVDEIERKLSIARKKKNERAICFTNKERLIIVSMLLKVKGIARSYEPSKHGGYRELFIFNQIEEGVA